MNIKKNAKKKEDKRGDRQIIAVPFIFFLTVPFSNIYVIEFKMGTPEDALLRSIHWLTD
jgi:hypothetical protein